MDEVAKRSAARAAAELVKPGMRIGLGTGSSFGFALERIGERMMEEDLEVIGVASSQATQRLAEKLGIPLLDPGDVDALDLAIDGADEVDPARNLTKGGGGALLRERIVAALATELVVVIGDNKLVQKLGTTFALPVEVLPFGWRQAKRAIAELGCEPELRHRRDQPFRTDNDNFVLDCRFPGIDDPAALYRDLNCIPGVLDNGLFVGMAGRVYVGNAQGEVTVLD